MTLSRFSPQLLARSHDPDTSYRAAEKVGNFRASHEARIFDWLQTHPEGSTYRQIAAGTGLEPVAVGRRLKGMRTSAGVYADGERDGMQIWKVRT